MDAVDAYAADYQQCEIMGQKAIYTESLIDRHSVPDGYYAYDIRDPIGDGEICEIRNFIRHGRDGTFIICKPIDGADCGVVITEEEMTLYGKATTLNDYIDSWRTIEDMVIKRHIRGTDYLFTLSDDEESEIYNSRLLEITKLNIIIYFECEELMFSNHEITDEDIRKIALLVINRYDDLNVPYWDNIRSAITDYANTHNITVVLDGDKMEENTMIPVPASEGDYEEFEVLGQNALFSNYRIDRSTIPDGLYAYDLRDSCNGIACELKDHITVNHFGTVIVKNPIDGAENGIALTEDDTCFFGTESTIDEFLDRSEEEDNQPEP